MSEPDRPLSPGRGRQRIRRGLLVAIARTRVRLALAAGCVILVVAVVVATRSGSVAPPPLPGTGVVPRSGDPFAYSADREAEFVSRATAGCAQPLFTKSPGGALATAARVAGLHGAVEAAVRGTGVDPALVEGIVFVESAGRPYAVAGSDPAAATGLTQILASTATSLLGMHVDLATDRRLMAKLAAGGSSSQVTRLLAALRRADDRFDPRRALAATVRYLQQARAKFGREDLAVVSYHMGIGNLHHVLQDYDGGDAVPYAQLYFDTAPDHHADAFRLLTSFGDQSSLYYWRVLGAVQIMRLYRSDRAALRRLATLQTAWDSTADVLHPPDQTAAFADPAALSSAYAARTLVPLPRNGAQLGLRYARSMGAAARAVHAPAALYRGLRPPALDLLSELAFRVRALSGSRAPLIVQSTVEDRRYQARLGFENPPATTGYSFALARRYGTRAQASALQAMLDRLQALNLIGWARHFATIDIVVAGDASRVIAAGV